MNNNIIGLAVVATIAFFCIGLSNQYRNESAKISSLKEINDPCAVNYDSHNSKKYKLEAITVDAYKSIQGSFIFVLGSVNERKEIEYTFYTNDNGNIQLRTAHPNRVTFRYINNEEPYAYNCDSFGANTYYFPWVIGIPYGSIQNTYNVDVEKTNLNK